MSETFIDDLQDHMRQFVRARYICRLINDTGASQITLKAQNQRAARDEVKEFLGRHLCWKNGYIKEKVIDEVWCIGERLTYKTVATVKNRAVI